MAERILAYLDRISCRPGDRLSLMVSAPEGPYQARLLRYRGGAIGGVPAPVEAVSGWTGFVAAPQPLAPGSYVDLPLVIRHDARQLTCCLWALPTLPALARVQTILDLEGLATIALVGGNLHLVTAAGTAVLAVDVAKRWLGLVLQIGADAISLLVYDARCRELGRVSLPGIVSAPETTKLRLAASFANTPADCFNGKLSAPRLCLRQSADPERLIAGEDAPSPDLAWDFARWDRIDRIRGIGGAPDGVTVNLPARGVTGRLWDGTAQKPADDPSHYDAIHFHDDDFGDAGWRESLEITLPPDLAGGVHAVAIEGNGLTERIPFFVSARSPQCAKVLLLIPTNTYLAYANERLMEFDLSEMMAHDVAPSAREAFVIAHPELGRSVYDLHSDGSGTFYSSRLRPVLNLHPEADCWLNAGPRHLAADLHIVGFLEQAGIAYDIATDEDLHREGAGLLAGYRTTLTASHPEYSTRAMMRALDTHIHSGGRLLYLGGNGFYWVCDLVDPNGTAIEIRRGMTGTRSWTSEPGEAHLSVSGGIGGLWRHAGHPPNSMTGLGFAAEGWGRASAYRRLEASRSGPAARFFAGIDDDLIGTAGLALSGAAGDEVDRFDAAFGAPGKVHHLATSEPLDARYRLVIEDQLVSASDTRGGHHPDVRADMLYIETESGGRIFSTGSICFAAALPADGFRNPVARLLANVLEDFLARP